MSKIDTNFWRQVANGYVALPSANTCLRAAADELDRLYLDTTPLTREGLKEVLKEAGFVQDSDWRWLRKRNAGMQMVIFDHDTVSLTKDPDELDVNAPDFGNFPLAAVTRQTLRACGVIK